MDPRIPCRDCSMWPCLCGNHHITRADRLTSERDWIDFMAERNDRARRIRAMRKARVPRDDSAERTLLVMVVILALLPIAVGGIVWLVK